MVAALLLSITKMLKFSQNFFYVGVSIAKTIKNTVNETLAGYSESVSSEAYK